MHYIVWSWFIVEIYTQPMFSKQWCQNNCHERNHCWHALTLSSSICNLWIDVWSTTWRTDTWGFRCVRGLKSGLARYNPVFESRCWRRFILVVMVVTYLSERPLCRWKIKIIVREDRGCDVISSVRGHSNRSTFLILMWQCYIPCLRNGFLEKNHQRI